MSRRAGDKHVRRYFDPKLFRGSKYRDADIDRMVSAAETRLEGVALQELALRHAADVSDVIVVRYPNLSIAPVVSGDDIYVGVGRDGQFRFSSYSFHLVFVTRNHLSTYTATWNMITDAVGEGDWEEWPYRHIVSVEAGPLEEELPAIGRKAKKRRKKHGPQMAVVGYYFTVRNAGGGTLDASIEDKSIRLRLRDQKLARDDSIGRRQSAMTDIAQHFKSSQRRLRDVLRDREAAASGGPDDGIETTIPPPPLRPLPDLPHPFAVGEDE